MGKKTALAILAATRMPAITTVKVSNLRMAFSFTLKSRFAPNIPGCAGSWSAIQRQTLSDQNSSIVAPRSPRLHFSPIEKFPSCAWSLRSGISSMDDCLNGGAAGGYP